MVWVRTKRSRLGRVKRTSSGNFTLRCFLREKRDKRLFIDDKEKQRKEKRDGRTDRQTERKTDEKERKTEGKKGRKKRRTKKEEKKQRKSKTPIHSVMGENSTGLSNLIKGFYHVDGHKDKNTRHTHTHTCA